MTHKFIKREIPTEISEAGGAMIVLVDKDTVELETSIQEAQDGLYVIGDKLLIKGFFVGLMKSMIAGVQRDGHARQLADFLTIYPVVTGEFDLDTGWNPAVNGVKIRVRLMNEMALDISSWEFEDVTPGRVPFKIESVKAGETAGVVLTGQAIEMNGRNLPLTDAIKVEWALADGSKSGTVAAAKVASTVSRTDINGDALSELDLPTYDGKEIGFTVRGNCANAKISALLKYDTRTKVTLSNVELQASGKGIAFNCDHCEALAGYDATAQSVPVTVRRTGKADETVTATWIEASGVFTGTVTGADFAAGDTATIIASVDPTKTSYRPGKISATGTAT